MAGEGAGACVHAREGTLCCKCAAGGWPRGWVGPGGKESTGCRRGCNERKHAQGIRFRKGGARANRAVLCNTQVFGLGWVGGLPRAEPGSPQGRAGAPPDPAPVKSPSGQWGGGGQLTGGRTRRRSRRPGRRRRSCPRPGRRHRTCRLQAEDRGGQRRRGWRERAAEQGQELAGRPMRCSGCWAHTTEVGKPSQRRQRARAHLTAQELAGEGGEPPGGAVHAVGAGALAVHAVAARALAVDTVLAGCVAEGWAGRRDGEEGW